MDWLSGQADGGSLGQGVFSRGRLWFYSLEAFIGFAALPILSRGLKQVNLFGVKACGKKATRVLRFFFFRCWRFSYRGNEPVILHDATDVVSKWGRWHAAMSCMMSLRLGHSLQGGAELSTHSLALSACPQVWVWVVAGSAPSRTDSLQAAAQTASGPNVLCDVVKLGEDTVRAVIASLEEAVYNVYIDCMGVGAGHGGGAMMLPIL
ncbi:hypothetical protein B0T19DRAFT_103207 [Cercophora scortea]|uniref:Uncharacterized protein n=1 Tax=Cercophora scortea TaxID=314031 RepID=A0AAE0MH89_9PEZI|nr:hypothetical protein B0T19DRAFT_103207 [Cercophora scortea]